VQSHLNESTGRINQGLMAWKSTSCRLNYVVTSREGGFERFKSFKF